MVRLIRPVTGCVLFAFITMHLINHAFGIAGPRTAEAAADWLTDPWGWMPLSILLMLSMTLHWLNALVVSYKRRSLRMHPWEWAQLLIGLSLPFLLVGHVIGQSLLAKLLDVNFEHLETLYVISVVDPFEGVLLATGMLAAWIHGCIGLHHWLGLKPWYRRWLWLIAALAVLIPALSIAGTISATLDVIARDLANPAWMPERFERIGATAEIGDILNRWTNATLLVLLVCTALPFVARFVRAWLDKLSARPRIHLTDGRAIAVHSGATVLETLREHGVAIASVCGGRARCTTCRVNLFLGAEKQTAPEEQEAKALGKFGVDLSGSKTIRLACRLKPTSDVTLAPVFSPDVTMGEARRSGGLEGQETLVSCMFIDLRGSTKLGESRLPYDVLFLLNQFFAEMTEAIAESRGHYAQFNGDGLMALYGLGEDTSPAEGARDALRGARRMVDRLAALNQSLAHDLPEPLKMGIGIHHGPAIVGAMGPPDGRILSAIGDTINTAARLESQTKERGVALVTSTLLWQVAELDPPQSAKVDAVVLRGREQSLPILAIPEPPEIER